MSISITVNGKQVQVPAGASVLDAVNASNTYLSQLCKDPDMKAIGACRTCLVQIEGMRGFPASCSVPAADGMVVRTDTPEVERIRSGVLELTLAMLPSDAPAQHAVPSPIRGEGEYGQLTRAAEHYGIERFPLAAPTPGGNGRQQPRFQHRHGILHTLRPLRQRLPGGAPVHRRHRFSGGRRGRAYRYIHGQAPGRLHLHHLRPVPVRLSHRRHPGQGHYSPVRSRRPSPPALLPRGEGRRSNR